MRAVGCSPWCLQSLHVHAGSAPTQPSAERLEGCRAGLTGAKHGGTDFEYQGGDRLDWDMRVQHWPQSSSDQLGDCRAGLTGVMRGQAEHTDGRWAPEHREILRSRQSGWDTRVQHPPQPLAERLEGCRAGLTGELRGGTDFEYQVGDRLDWDMRVQHWPQSSSDQLGDCRAGLTGVMRGQGEHTDGRWAPDLGKFAEVDSPAGTRGFSTHPSRRLKTQRAVEKV